MHPKIKSILCVNHDPIEEWTPEDPERVNIYIELDIGPAEDIGADIFGLHIVTTLGWDKDDADYGDQKALILDSYSWDEVWKWLNQLTSECVGKDWAECSQKLSKKLDWEFDGYQTFCSEDA